MYFTILLSLLTISLVAALVLIGFNALTDSLTERVSSSHPTPSPHQLDANNALETSGSRGQLPLISQGALAKERKFLNGSSIQGE